jgi:hypothetical protein
MFGYQADSDSGIEGASVYPLFREVTDDELYFPPKHKKDHDPGALPESLKRAIYSFILTCSARRARGQRNAHNSMLVHVTRFTAVQEKVKELTEQEFIRIKNALKYDAASPVWEELRTLWDDDFELCCNRMRTMTDDSLLTPVSWTKAKAELATAVDKIEIREIHGKSPDELNYDRYPNGLSVVAIGGNKLSRGLTLEGLSVSYFVRQTKMYDTLMQMGRWFGYRDGYLDICRLFTTEELRDWFSHIAFAEEELRREFEDMSDARLTPADYGLRVRQHPDGMIVTALNKMAHGESREVTFAGKLVQTAFFTRDADIQKERKEAVGNWLESLSDFRKDSKGYFRWTASREDLLSLLMTFSQRGFTNSKCSRFGPEIKKYIEAQAESAGLAQWTVIVPSGKAETQNVGGHEFRPIQRRDETADANYYSLSKANVQDPAHEILDLEEIILSEDLVEELLEKREMRSGGLPDMALIKEGAETALLRENIGGKASDVVVKLGELRGKSNVGALRDEIRQLRPVSRVLLTIYMLDTSKVKGLEAIPYIPAFALSFPATHRAKKVKYLVNQTWIGEQLERFNLTEDDDDDEN